MQVYILMQADPYQFEGTENTDYVAMAYDVHSVHTSNHAAERAAKELKREYNDYYLTKIVGKELLDK